MNYGMINELIHAKRRAMMALVARPPKKEKKRSKKVLDTRKNVR